MRTGTIFALAALLAASSGDAAGRHHRPERAGRIDAAPKGSTSAVVTALRSPGPEAILLRAGAFRMGSNEAEIAHAATLCRLEPRGEDCTDALANSFSNEYAPHEVYLDAFWIDRSEVSVARYARCVAAGICAPPPYASGGTRFQRADYPVVLVTWDDAQRFCAWAGGRLPTEAEWERAASGLAARRYPWGNVYNAFLSNHGSFALDELDARDGFLELAPVGSFPDGRTPDGIDDLAGNVEEWVADRYAPEYPAATSSNPKGPDSGEERVIRGGSYLHGRPWLRSAARWHDPPTARRAWRGFRCARTD